MPKKLPKNLNNLELFLLSVGTTVPFMIVYMIAFNNRYPLQVLIGSAIFGMWSYIMYWGYFTETGRKAVQEARDKQLRRIIQQQAQTQNQRAQQSPSVSITNVKYPYEPSSIPKIMAELKAIKEQVRIAKNIGDRDLENALKKREQELITQNQKIQMFVFTRGFRR